MCQIFYSGKKCIQKNAENHSSPILTDYNVNVRFFIDYCQVLGCQYDTLEKTLNAHTLHLNG